MTGHILGILRASCCGSLFFLYLMCCKRWILKRFGAKFWHRAMIANSVLFMAPIYPLELAVSRIAQPLRSWIQDIAYYNGVYGRSYFASGPPAESGTAKAVLAIWLCGASAILAAKVALHVLAAAKAGRKSHTASAAIQDVFSSLILGDSSINKARRLDNVCLLACEDIASPVTYGFFRKKIVLPDNLEGQFDDGEICLMLWHEAVHIRDGDSWKRLFLLLVHACNWFNPISIWFFRRANDSIELSCDEKTVSCRNSEEVRLKYCELLMNMAKGMRSRSLSGQHMVGSRFISQRIQSVASAQAGPKAAVKVLFLSLAVAMLLACATGFAAFDPRMEPASRLGVVDSGERSQRTEAPQPAATELAAWDLSQAGGYAFDGRLFGGEVNFVPAAFTTHSSRIVLTLLSDERPVTAYIYYSADLSYPLMQLVLDEKGAACAFTSLSNDYDYSIGFVVDSSFESNSRVSVQE